MKINLSTYILLSITCLFTINASASSAANMGFSKYRILLTPKQKSEHLTLFNKGDEQAKCEIGLNHYQISKNNKLQRVDLAEQAFMPANRLLRYSPRRAIIPARASQKIRLNIRRKANQPDGEFTSYINMKCSTESTETEVTGEGQMGAIISYNIPVHVQVGELAATSELALLSVNPLTKEKGHSYEVVVRQFRKGNRALIGDLEVLDLASGKTVEKKTGFGLYQPSEFMDHKFVLRNKPSKGLEVIFTESQEYGGGVVQKMLVGGTEF